MAIHDKPGGQQADRQAAPLPARPLRGDRRDDELAKTRQEASRAIERLKTRPRSDAEERRRDRREVKTATISSAGSAAVPKRASFVASHTVMASASAPSGRSSAVAAAPL